MKKFALAAALAIAATTASAGVTAFATLDYDNANAGQGLNSAYEGVAGAALDTKFGTFDAGVVGRRVKAAGADESLGFEVGYTNGLKLGAVGIKGRAAYGRVNQVATGNTAYYSLAAEAGLPLTSNVSAFVGYRHRNGLNAETAAAANRYTAGVDVTLAKNIGVRVGYAHSRVAGVTSNGLTSAVSYKF